MYWAGKEVLFCCLDVGSLTGLAVAAGVSSSAVDTDAGALLQAANRSGSNKVRRNDDCNLVGEHKMNTFGL